MYPVNAEWSRTNTHTSNYVAGHGGGFSLYEKRGGMRPYRGGNRRCGAPSSAVASTEAVWRQRRVVWGRCGAPVLLLAAATPYSSGSIGNLGRAVVACSQMMMMIILNNLHGKLNSANWKRRSGTFSYFSSATVGVDVSVADSALRVH